LDVVTKNVLPYLFIYEIVVKVYLFFVNLERFCLEKA
jgi:hypothetical protein